MTTDTRTGWPPGLLQDDSRELSRWFASRPDARRVVRAVAAEIESGCYFETQGEQARKAAEEKAT